MVDIISEIVEVAGRKKIKITLQDGDQVIDADLIDPFQAAQRHKAALRLAKRAGQENSEEEIEKAVVAKRPEQPPLTLATLH